MHFIMRFYLHNACFEQYTGFKERQMNTIAGRGLFEKESFSLELFFQLKRCLELDLETLWEFIGMHGFFLSSLKFCVIG